MLREKRILIIGSRHSGKTQLGNILNGEEYSEDIEDNEHEITFGMSVIDTNKDSKSIKLQTMEFSPKPSFDFTLSIDYRSYDRHFNPESIILFCIDTTKQNALKEARQLYQEYNLDEKRKTLPVYFIFNKSDAPLVSKESAGSANTNQKSPVKQQRHINDAECKAFAKEFNISETRTFITSAKNESNIPELKKQIVNECEHSVVLRNQNDEKSVNPDHPGAGNPKTKNLTNPIIPKLDVNSKLTKNTIRADLGSSAAIEKLTILYLTFQNIKFAAENAAKITAAKKPSTAHSRCSFFGKRRNNEYNDLQLENIEALKKAYLDVVKKAAKNPDIAADLKIAIESHKTFISFQRTTYERCVTGKTTTFKEIDDLLPNTLLLAPK